MVLNIISQVICKGDSSAGAFVNVYGNNSCSSRLHLHFGPYNKRLEDIELGS